MNAAGQTICLCMIVKNEAHVLRRCLESVIRLIDTWVIVDTGSTDGTQELVREFFREIPGELVERPWKNFAHNRSESVALARPRADYVMIMDADETLQPDAGFAWPLLSCDAYDFQAQSGTIDWYRVQLVRSALPWRYEGVLHEYLTCDGAYSKEHLNGLRVIVRQEGARSRDPLTYRKDALVLEEALLREPASERHMFYLGQSYRDAGEPELALDRYRRRVAMGGWAEEAWYALYQVAAIQHDLGREWPVVQEAYLQAFAARPTRAEPLYRVGLYYQQRQQFALGMLFLTPAMQIAYPADDLLFVEADVYCYLLPLEYAVACYWLGRHEEAIAVTDRLLADASLGADRVEHLQRNRAFSVDALRARAS